MKERVVLGTAGADTRVLLPPKARETHMHILGASGRGKSKFIEGLIRQDILNREGLCLIDPHGHLYEELVRWCTREGFLRDRNIILLDPAAEGWSFGFNPLHFDRSHELSFGIDAMVRVFSQVWGGEDTDRTPLLKRCLRSIFYVLAEKRLTLLEAVHLCNESDPVGIREYLTADLRDSVFRDQWQRFNSLSAREYREQFGSTSNRMLEFLSAPIIRRIIGQTEEVLDIRRCMDEGAIVLVNLSSGGRLSDDNARLLGSLLVNDLFLHARQRPKNSRPFYLYIDECALFLNDDVRRILDEGRKFGLHLILAHQHLSHLREAGESIYSAVMTNAQAKVVFGGLSPEDAKIMAEMLFMGELDLRERKLSARVVTGYVRDWLESHSESFGSSHGESDGGSVSESENEVFDADGESLSTSVTSTGASSGGTSYTESHSFTSGRSETLRPVLTTRTTQVYSLQEQIYRSMATMVNQPTRSAIVKLPEGRTQAITTSYVGDTLAADERVATFKERVFERSSFARSETKADELIDARKAQLEHAAETTVHDREPSSFLE